MHPRPTLTSGVRDVGVELVLVGHVVFFFALVVGVVDGRDAAVWTDGAADEQAVIWVLAVHADSVTRGAMLVVLARIPARDGAMLGLRARALAT